VTEHLLPHLLQNFRITSNRTNSKQPQISHLKLKQENRILNLSGTKGEGINVETLVDEEAS